LADFTLMDAQRQNQAPVKLKTTNTSKNASSYIWKVNGEEVSTESELVQNLYESGRYVIELTAMEEGKSDTKRKEIIIKPSEQCLVLMKTSEGDMIFHLLEETPRHLRNMEKLIASKYYNGLLFHRVIDDFMIQGGDNNTRSSGRRHDEPETIDHEINMDFPHYRGALAAARMPDDVNPEKASSGSQFYVVDGRPLDRKKMEKFQKQTS